MDPPCLSITFLCLNHMWNDKVSLPSVIQVLPRRVFSWHRLSIFEMYEERLGVYEEK